METEPYAINRRIRRVLDIHFDAEGGTPFWLERAAGWGFDPRDRIQSVNDLPLLGMMDVAAMHSRPIWDFVPRQLRDQPEDLIFLQTGGTLGRPLWTAYTNRDFEEAFVTPFVAAAEHVDFPKGGNWLYVGPSGPHAMGRAAISLARVSHAPAPFIVDVDARWARKFSEGSFAAGRYLEHIVEQVISVAEIQPIDVIFTTPVILAALADRMDPRQRQRIRGVHYGGTALAPADLARFQAELFPNAVHLSGYGNTLFGCCLELTAAPGRRLEYFPHGNRLVLGVMDPRQNIPQNDRSIEKGRLVFSRLDDCCLIVNFAERDIVQLVNPPPGAPTSFASIGVANPRPAKLDGRPVADSLY